MLSDATILQHIARQSKRQAGYKQLVRELGLHGDERRELNDHLQKLVKSGALIPLDSDRYALPQAAADKNLVAGRLTMHRDGFGFVIPDSKSLIASLKSKLSGDIFIPPHQIGNAMHGDLVLVDIINVRPDGRAEGRIVRPVNRAHPTVVGIFHYGNRRNYVTPLDAKITQEIVIPEGMELPASSVSPVSSVVKDVESQPPRTQKTQRKEVRRPRPRRRSRQSHKLGRSGRRRRRRRNHRLAVTHAEPARTRHRNSRPRRRLRRRRRNHDPQIPSPAPLPRRDTGRSPASLRHHPRPRTPPPPRLPRPPHRHHRRRNRPRLRRRRPRPHAPQQQLRTAGPHRRRRPIRHARAAPSIRKPVCAAPASTSPTAPSPCCRSNSRPTSAACARTSTASYSPASWKSTTAARSSDYDLTEGVIRSAERMTYTVGQCSPRRR